MTDLEKSMEERKKLDAEKERRKNSSWEKYETVKYCSADNDNRRIFRLTGKPVEVRENAFDAKAIKFSRWVRDDNNGYGEIVWKTDHRGNLDESWFLYRFMQDLMHSTYHEYTKEEKELDPAKQGEKGAWVLDHRDSTVCQKLAKNKSKVSKFGVSFYPTELVLINVIDRNDMWCNDNNHTKILVKRVDTWQDAKTGEMIEKANEPGISQSLYRQLIELYINSACKTWSDKDFAVKKIGKKGEYWLSIRDNVADLGVSSALTEKELSYVKYDLDKIKSVTSYSKIMKYWGKLIKAYDVESNNSYYEELEILVDKEKEQLKEKEQIEKVEPIQEQPKVEVAPVVEKKVEEVKVETPVETVKIENAIDLPIQAPVHSRTSINKVYTLEDIFPKFNELSEVDKKLIKETFRGVDEVKKEILWDKSVDIGFCTDVNCTIGKFGIKCTSPINLTQCPNCGRVFANDLK